MKKHLTQSIILIFFCIFSTAVLAQGPSDPGLEPDGPRIAIINNVAVEIIQNSEPASNGILNERKTEMLAKASQIPSEGPSASISDFKHVKTGKIRRLQMKGNWLVYEPSKLEVQE